MAATSKFQTESEQQIQWVLEENPKWNILLEILEEIEQEVSKDMSCKLSTWCLIVDSCCVLDFPHMMLIF